MRGNDSFPAQLLSRRQLLVESASPLLLGEGLLVRSLYGNRLGGRERISVRGMIEPGAAPPGFAVPCFGFSAKAHLAQPSPHPPRALTTARTEFEQVLTKIEGRHDDARRYGDMLPHTLDLTSPML